MTTTCKLDSRSAAGELGMLVLLQQSMNAPEAILPICNCQQVREAGRERVQLGLVSLRVLT